MDIKSYLADYAQSADKYLTSFFQQKKKESGQIAQVIEGLTGCLADFTAGGKKVRGALIKLGYECAGGRNQKAILKASCAIELFQNFLLIHDDIIDLSETRRGKPTVHRQYEKEYGRHYGSSMAIICGDMAAFWGYEILLSSGFSPDKAVATTAHLTQVLVTTGYGEILDIHQGYAKDYQEDVVLTIHRLKTARYTVSGPLQAGAILAGASQRVIAAMEAFGTPLGLAFQIKDDLLGVYGQESTIGKSVLSDMREGKNTLLITQAYKKAKAADKKILDRLWGNPKADLDDLEKMRTLFEKTGSLAYSQERMNELVNKAKSHIPQITKDKKGQQFLVSLADFVVGRVK